jgi:hypothetical protein
LPEMLHQPQCDHGLADTGIGTGDEVTRIIHCLPI